MLALATVYSGDIFYLSGFTTTAPRDAVFLERMKEIELSFSAWEADDAPIRSKAVVHDQKPIVAFGSVAASQNSDNRRTRWFFGMHIWHRSIYRMRRHESNGVWES